MPGTVSVATPTEVSQQLDIPPATLRRYVAVFGQYLSAEARLPRGRQFSEADLETLARIRALLGDGSSVEEVAAALGGGGTAPAQNTPAPTGSEQARVDVASSRREAVGQISPEPVTDRASVSSVAAAPMQPSVPSQATQPRPGVEEPSPIAAARAEDDTLAAVDEDADAEDEEERPRWRSYARVQPVRSSREARKMVAELGGVDHLSQRLALAEDRLLNSNERMAVLEARVARLEEWLRMPWYRRLLAKPPDYNL